MTELPPTTPDHAAADTGARTAGELLKAAREQAGMHLTVLAAAIKVAPAKLEALEQNRLGDLPNATFTRALAQSVCRSLKIDPRPVLALLPRPEAQSLEPVGGKLNTPFRDRGPQREDVGLAWASKPMFWAGGLLLLAALVVALLPTQWLTPADDAGAPTSTSLPLPASAPAVLAAVDAAASGVAQTVTGAASAAASVAVAAAAALVPAEAASAAAPAPAAGATAPAAASRVLQLSVSAPSWIEVIDGRGQTLLSRDVLPTEEAPAFDGPLPLRVRVGNAGVTTVTLRGQAVDLGPYTRNNVARLELR